MLSITPALGATIYMHALHNMHTRGRIIVFTMEEDPSLKSQSASSVVSLCVQLARVDLRVTPVRENRTSEI